MRFRDTRSLDSLIDTALKGISKNQKPQVLLMRAWYEILPQTKGQLGGTFMRGKALYIKVNNSFLRHKLSLSKGKIYKDLVNALVRLGGNRNVIEDLFFM